MAKKANPNALNLTVSPLDQPDFYKNTMSLDNVPFVDVSDLTPKSSLQDAFHAFIRSRYVQSKIEAGSARAHEPYVSLARLLSLVSIEEGATRRFAATFRDKDLSKLASGTVNMILSKLNNLYKWLYDYGIAEANPWGLIARAAVTPKRRLVRKLSPKEIDSVLAYLDSVKHRNKNLPSTIYGDMFRLSLLTAMRYSEVLTLTADNYFPEQGYAMVTASYAKTRVARRVFLAKEAIEILDRYRPAQDGGRFFPVRYNALVTALYRYKEKTGAEIFYHLARHTAISDYAEKCDSINELRAFSGHTSASSAARYMHVDYEALKETVLARLNG